MLLPGNQFQAGVPEPDPAPGLLTCASWTKSGREPPSTRVTSPGIFGPCKSFLPTSFANSSVGGEAVATLPPLGLATGLWVPQVQHSSCVETEVGSGPVQQEASMRTGPSPTPSSPAILPRRAVPSEGEALQGTVPGIRLPWPLLACYTGLRVSGAACSLGPALRHVWFFPWTPLIPWDHCVSLDSSRGRGPQLSWTSSIGLQ